MRYLATVLALCVGCVAAVPVENTQTAQEPDNGEIVVNVTIDAERNTVSEGQVRQVVIDSVAILREVWAQNRDASELEALDDTVLRYFSIHVYDETQGFDPSWAGLAVYNQIETVDGVKVNPIYIRYSVFWDLTSAYHVTTHEIQHLVLMSLFSDGTHNNPEFWAHKDQDDYDTALEYQYIVESAKDDGLYEHCNDQVRKYFFLQHQCLTYDNCIKHNGNHTTCYQQLIDWCEAGNEDLPVEQQNYCYYEGSQACAQFELLKTECYFFPYVVD